MSLWRQFTRGLHVLTHRRASDQEIIDEAQHYLDQATAEHIGRGSSPDEARRAARLELGTVAAVREQVRDYGWENLIDTLFSDLCYAARRLRSSPGFTTVSVLTLALGIGATTAIFSGVNPILFQALPYPVADRIMMLWEKRSDGSRGDGNFGTYRELAARSRSLDAIAVMKPWQPTMTGAAEPERFDGQRVSASYFRVLGVAPAIGKDFLAADDQLNGPMVVILSDALWRRRFGGDSTILGRSITLDDNSYLVLGIMPHGFENVVAPTADVWTPLQYDMSLGSAWGHHLHTIGRLAQGVDAEQAKRELDQIAGAPIVAIPPAPWASVQNGFIVTSLQDDLTRAVKPALLAVLGAVILVLAIACVNVSNLLLARSEQRRGEFAIRAALGAGRKRLIRQLLTESLLLAAIGGLVGMIVAKLGVRALVALSPAGLPRVNAIAVDGSVFAFATGVTVLIGIGFGLIPALHAARPNLQTGLRQGSRRTAGGHHGVRSTLVVAEVALALMLLVGSGLLLRSLQHLFGVAPGFNPSRLLTMQVQISGHRFDDDANTRQFFAQSLDAVRNIPGITAAGLTSQLPLSGEYDKYGVRFESSLPDDPEGEGGVFRYAISPGYIEAMGIPLRRGRVLDEHDITGAPLAALINESFAKRRFPGIDPIGQHLHLGQDTGPWFTIVGVVGDVKQLSLAVNESDAVYVPLPQWYFADHALSLVARSRTNPTALAPAIRAAIWSVDKDQPIVRVATMDDLVADSAAERRFALILFEAFALVALVLAAAGIYGVLSGSVTERTREIGVRSALGASRSHIVGLVVRQGMLLTGLGTLIGLIGAAAASQALISLLFGTSRLDPLTYLGVMVLLLAVSAIACWVPAWRAARVEPSITLRAE